MSITTRIAPAPSSATLAAPSSASFTSTTASPGSTVRAIASLSNLQTTPNTLIRSLTTLSDRPFPAAKTNSELKFQPVPPPNPPKTPIGDYYILPVNMSNTECMPINEKINQRSKEKYGKIPYYHLEKSKNQDSKDNIQYDLVAQVPTCKSILRPTINPQAHWSYAVVFDEKMQQLELRLSRTKHYLIADGMPILIAGDIGFENGVINYLTDRAGGYGIHNIAPLTDEEKYHYQQSMLRAAKDVGLPVEIMKLQTIYPKPATPVQPPSTAVASDRLFTHRPKPLENLAAIVPPQVPAKPPEPTDSCSKMCIIL